jgi:hypothetical protein
MAKTVSMDLAAKPLPRDLANRSTAGVGYQAGRHGRLPFDVCFASAYPAIAAACRGVEEPGIAIAAVDDRTGQLVGLTRVAARPDRHVAAVVGRHDHVDVFLATPDSLALRHFAVVLDPVRRWDRGVADVSYRILDLHTEAGLEDEHGTSLRGLRAEGPALLRCPGHAVFILPLGDPTDWPASAVLAWSYLPERVYFDERAHRRATPAPPTRAGRQSVLSQTRGPRGAHDLLGAGETAVAELHVCGPDGRHRLPIGASALDDGILLGRYARCDGSYLFASDAAISRVHLLLIRLDDRVVAIDTGSSNGTRWPTGEPFRAAQLAATDHLLLGGGATHLGWRGQGDRRDGVTAR